jgi:hypothetical protein
MSSGPKNIVTRAEVGERKCHSPFEVGNLIGNIDKGITTPGHKLDAGEEYIIVINICTESPGDYAFTRAPIPVGGTINLLDAVTGYDYLLTERNEDFIYKMVWLNFDQPVRWQIYRTSYQDYGCEAYIPAFNPTYITTYDVGWSRAQLEDTNQVSRHYYYVKNLGSKPAHGKAWIVGFLKEGTYDFF